MDDFTGQGGNSGQLPPLDSIAPQSGSSGKSSIDFLDHIKYFFDEQGSGGIAKIVLGFLAIVIVLYVAISLIPSGSTTPIVTNTPTNTVITYNVSAISNCTSISKPGKYYLVKSINAKSMSGACITIKSSNVELVGNNNKVIGIGPYTGVPPFSYGIYANGVSNVTVNGTYVSTFSYGIFLSNSTGSSLYYNNVTKNSLSGITLFNVSSSNVAYNVQSSGSAPFGGITLIKGTNNSVFNNTMLSNIYYGLQINSTNNTFYGNRFSNNTADIECVGQGGFSHSNKMFATACDTNYYCGFVSCYRTNIPFNISSVVLKSNVSTCGTIEVPGTYKLSGDLNVSDYWNSSISTSVHTTCIRVTVPNVKINCNGHSIIGSDYGIDISNQYNTTISNCVLSKQNIAGINATSNIYPIFNNDTISGSEYGVVLVGIQNGVLSGMKLSGNTYGLYTNKSSLITLANSKINNNKFGVYIGNVTSFSISNTSAFNDTKNDLYCTIDSYANVSSVVTGLSCGNTDCNWINSCNYRSLPPVKVFPVSSCYKVTSPGNYSLSQNISGGNNCIDIQASNVTFDCANHLIHGTNQGIAMRIDNQSNVAISNCYLQAFNTGVSASNTHQLNLTNLNLQSMSEGFNISGASADTFRNNYLYGFTSAVGMLLNNVQNSIIINNTVTHGLNSGIGFWISNSMKNLFSDNNAQSNVNYGFYFSNAINNTVVNNSAYINGKDYYCAQDSSQIFANSGSNQGSSKANCKWMVMTTPSVQQSNCFAITSGQTVSLSQDFLYGFGATCLSVFSGSQSANNTVINCNGHTIRSTNGGTFVDAYNVTNVKVENCILDNFTYGIKSTAQSTSVINDTFYKTKQPITILNTRYPDIEHVKVLNASYGVSLQNVGYAQVLHNLFAGTNMSLYLTGVSLSKFDNNTAQNSLNGAYLLNSTQNQFSSSNFRNVSQYGFSCDLESGSLSASLNRDNGNNRCSSNNGCLWVSSQYC